MTERLGAIRYGQEQNEVFLGRDMGHIRDYSEEVAAAIDEEVRGFIETAHQEAYDLLVANRDVLDAMVLALLERETLDKAEIEEIFAELQLREVRPAWTGSARRRPDERGPVETPKALSVSNGHAAGSNGHGSANGHGSSDGQPSDGATEVSDLA
jgi:cell division protease FtsH